MRRHSNAQDGGLQQPLVDGQPSDVEKQEGSRRRRVVVGVDKPESSTWGGEYVKSIVYGGLDAIVTSFALVASVSGGDLPAGWLSFLSR